MNYLTKLLGLLILISFQTPVVAGYTYSPNTWRFDETGASPHILFEDGAKNLYGITTGGNGTVFKLTPTTANPAVFTRTILWSFNGADGAGPNNLIKGENGKLYGTTRSGGGGNCAEISLTGPGCGTVFQLTPGANPQDNWTLKTLVAFNATNGAFPANLLRDSAGNLYGMTSGGGVKVNVCVMGGGCGVVFQLIPPSGTQTTWTYYYKALIAPDGFGSGPMAIGANGNVYFAPRRGGLFNYVSFNNFCPTVDNGGCGTLYELIPGTINSNFRLNFVLRFTTGNQFPNTMLAHPSGKIYVGNGGNGAHGSSIFEYVPGINGAPGTGSYVSGFGGVGIIVNGLYLGPEGLFKGQIYGTTRNGGSKKLGTVFRILPPTATNPSWTQETLKEFNGTDGAYPTGLLRFDSTAMYGLTEEGGDYNTSCTLFPAAVKGCGVVFKLSPSLDIPPRWGYQVLHAFSNLYDPFNIDGLGPNGLVWTSSGKLYGSTSVGGTGFTADSGFVFDPTNPYQEMPVYGNGLIYDLTPY